MGSAWLPGSGRKVENQIFDARTAHLDGRRHSNAKANFQGTVRTDPEAPEKNKHDFQHVQDRTILGGELGFAIRTRLHGHRRPFLNIGGRTGPRSAPENTLISTSARPHKAPKTTPENPKSPKTQITSQQQPIFDTHQVGSAWLPGSGRKVENQIFDARTTHLAHLATYI